MIGLLQRVTQAAVSVGGGVVAQIDTGLLVLVGVQKTDGEDQADRLLQRILGYRVFADVEGKMNLSLQDRAHRGQQAGLLLVPQFTLPADTRKGMRPSFSSAAPPDQGRRLFEYLVTQAQANHTQVGSGIFGADMQVSLINDGPVTFWLQVN